MADQDFLEVSDVNSNILSENFPHQCHLPTSPFSPTDSICETPKVYLYFEYKYRIKPFLLLMLLLQHHLLVNLQNIAAIQIQV